MPSVGNVLGHIEEKAPTAFSRGVAQAPEHQPRSIQRSPSGNLSFPGNNTLEALKKTAAGNPEQAGPSKNTSTKQAYERSRTSRRMGSEKNLELPALPKLQVI